MDNAGWLLLIIVVDVIVTYCTFLGVSERIATLELKADTLARITKALLTTASPFQLSQIEALTGVTVNYKEQNDGRDVSGGYPGRPG